MVVMSDGEGAWETTTTSKEGTRRANYPIHCQGHGSPTCTLPRPSLPTHVESFLNFLFSIQPNCNNKNIIATKLDWLTQLKPNGMFGLRRGKSGVCWKFLYSNFKKISNIYETYQLRLKTKKPIIMHVWKTKYDDYQSFLHTLFPFHPTAIIKTWCRQNWIGWLNSNQT